MDNDDISTMASFYRDQYGDATDELFLALAKPAQKVALVNPFIDSKASQQFFAGYDDVSGFEGVLKHLPSDLSPTPIDGLLSHYFMDMSSIYAAKYLPLAPHMRVLDMCSAPGGKLLYLMSRALSDVHMWANDISAARALRLRRVLSLYVPADFLAQYVRVSQKDAVRLSMQQRASFDAVLLDAPCSSEAHVVQNPRLLKSFRGPSKNLPHRQYALLCAALQALKVGGHVMYSTCSINKAENQGVIQKLLRKNKMAFSLVPLNNSDVVGLKDEFGVSILPHLHQIGPAFWSLIKKEDDAAAVLKF